MTPFMFYHASSNKKYTMDNPTDNPYDKLYDRNAAYARYVCDDILPWRPQFCMYVYEVHGIIHLCYNTATFDSSYCRFHGEYRHDGINPGVCGHLLQRLDDKTTGLYSYQCHICMLMWSPRISTQVIL